tara:strand:+ start:11814 stop:12119 length:306 start_codon:yes stop_codon:yes gene_type:complete
MSALEGYPQTHQSPEIIHVDTQHDTNKYEGPFSSIKCLGDAAGDIIQLILYFDKTDYDAGTGYTVKAVAADTISGPIQGFVLHTGSATNAEVLAYKYSSHI